VRGREKRREEKEEEEGEGGKETVRGGTGEKSGGKAEI